MQFGFLLEQVVNGLVLGGYYLLIALGLSLIFSVGGIVNLAHGAFYALGAYASLEIAKYTGFGPSVVLSPVAVAQTREAAERQAIEVALLRHRGRLGDAAQELGISRVTLYRLLCSHGMRHMEGEPLATPHGELPASVPHL